MASNLDSNNTVVCPKPCFWSDHKKIMKFGSIAKKRLRLQKHLMAKDKTFTHFKYYNLFFPTTYLCPSTNVHLLQQNSF